MPDIALRLEAVSHVFHQGTPSEVRALDRVDLELERGTFTVVLGTNGSGKSSLLNAIAGSLALAAGRVYLDGRGSDPLAGTAAGPPDQPGIPEPVHRYRVRPERRGEPGARRPTRRPAVARPGAGPRSAEGDAGIGGPLGMGLEDRLDTPIGLLSGGQRQALTVLMATMVRPTLLLLDEHTAALDPRSAEQVIRLTQRAVAAGGLTTLMVTHSLIEGVQLGDRVLVMHRGRVVYDLDTRRRQA